MNIKRLKINSILVVFLLVLLSACASGNKSSEPAAEAGGNAPAGDSVTGAAPAELTDLTIFSVAQSGLEMPTWVALDHNLFQKYGINPKWTTLPHPTGVQALLSGDAHIGAVPGNAITAFAAGSKNLMFVAGNNNYPIYNIMANENVTSPEDLRGKKVGLGGKYSAPGVTLMYYMENELGLKADVDYEMVSFKSSSEVVPALERGLIDAGIMSSPADKKAEKFGAKSVINLTESLLLAHAYITTTQEFASEHPDLVTNYLKAYAEGMAMAKKDPQIGIDSILKHMPGITEEDAKLTYESYAHLQDVNMTPEAITAYQQYSDNPLSKEVNAADMFNYSFLEELEKSGFLKEHGFAFKMPEAK